jgi:hypothetical protein
MKKNVLKFASLALGLCVATALTSCHSGEDYEAAETQTVEIPVIKANSLQIFTSVPASVAVGTAPAVNSTADAPAEFTSVAETGTIIITPDDLSKYEKKTINYNMNGKELVVLNVELVGKVVAVSQTAAESGTSEVNNDGANADDSGVSASFDFGANNTTNTDGSVTGDYSISVITPESTIDGDEVKAGNTYKESPLALDCKPDGAQFGANPLKVNLTIKDSKGYNLKFKNGTEELTPTWSDNDKLSVEIPHFSVWDAILDLACAKMTPSTKTYTETVDAQLGQVAFEDVLYGYETAETSVIANKILKKLFGTPVKKVKKTAKWSAVEGEATVTLTQAVKDYEFNAGKTIKVTVYGKVESKVVVETSSEEIINKHGGGSN